MSNKDFRRLHENFLLLPNAWDAGSARLVESLGAPAIATTSAGVAWSRGYPDGDALPLEQLVAVALEIARAIRVPFTIDIEGGYSDDPATVADVVLGVIDAGASGINIEDGPGSADLLCAKIEAARRISTRANVDLFINARTDVFLRELATGEAAVEEVLRRAKLYRAAGGDGLFVPGLSNGSTIEIDALRKLGVRRLSAGAAIAQAALGLIGRLAHDFLDGSWTEMFANAVDYGTTNRLFDFDDRKGSAP
jgi:2-methylisocitrate lyase-like PEP mutase family enzyme